MNTLMIRQTGIPECLSLNITSCNMASSLRWNRPTYSVFRASNLHLPTSSFELTFTLHPWFSTVYWLLCKYSCQLAGYLLNTSNHNFSLRSMPSNHKTISHIQFDSNSLDTWYVYKFMYLLTYRWSSFLTNFHNNHVLFILHFGDFIICVMLKMMSWKHLNRGVIMFELACPHYLTI